MQSEKGIWQSIQFLYMYYIDIHAVLHESI